MVLKQLADGSDPPVSKMVYIVGLADAVIHPNQIADRRHHIVSYDVAGYKLVNIRPYMGLKSVSIHVLS